jgi:glycosyltransferase involved in cell wall biosynthesis
MKIDLLFITYNRLFYTRQSLPALLADPSEEFSLTLWDNGSTDGTREYLTSVTDRRITRKVFSDDNIRLHGAINDIVRRSSADLMGVIPDDILMVPGWTRPLAAAHAEVAELGLIGCWHLGPEFFDEEKARHKIQTFGRHRILRHPWTGGGAGLVKLSIVRELGPLSSSATTDYWVQMALRGYVNGYYYPLIHVEHMDYPWSEHYAYADRPAEGIQNGVACGRGKGYSRKSLAGQVLRRVAQETEESEESLRTFAARFGTFMLLHESGSVTRCGAVVTGASIMNRNRRAGTRLGKT